ISRIVSRDGNDQCLAVANNGDADAVFLSLGDAASLEPGATYSIQWDYQSSGSARGRVELVTSQGEVLAAFPFESDTAKWTVGNVECRIPGETACGLRWIAEPGSEFLFDNVNIIRVDEVVPFSLTDFEDGWSDWQPAGNGRVVTAADGTKSLKASADTVG